MTFGAAIRAMTDGLPVTRLGWNGKGLFVFRQVPSLVPCGLVPRMTSLPERVKEVLVARVFDLRYKDQFCLVSPDSTLQGWAPSAPDVLAEDWEVFDPSSGFAVAGDTVGTGRAL